MKTVSISDVSISQINNSSTVSLNFKEKLELCKKLAELNVDAIEFDNVLNNQTEQVLLKTACTCITKSTIACVCGLNEKSVEDTFALLSSAKRKKLIIKVPVSPAQMEYFTSKKPKAVLDLLSNLTVKAVSLCDEVEVCLDDATRAEPAFLHSAIKCAIESGAKTVCLTDLAGLMLANEFGEFIQNAYTNVPELKGVKLAVMVKDTCSMASACVMQAIFCGVDQVKLCAVEGFALTDYQTFISAMATFGEKKGYNTKLNYTGAKRIVKQIAQLLDNKSNTAFSGVSENDDNAVINDTDIQSFSKLVKKMGYDLVKDDLNKVYQEFIALTKKKEVSAKELEVIIANTALQVPETYKIENFSVQISNTFSAIASIVLKEGDKNLSGLSYGNGSIDAAFLAIEKATGRHYELDSFEVGAVTEGKEAMGQTLIKLRSNGKLYSGRGLSTDIVGASIKAYINALNKIVYEEID